jgi:hypothetical protein
MEEGVRTLLVVVATAWTSCASFKTNSPDPGSWRVENGAQMSAYYIDAGTEINAEEMGREMLQMCIECLASSAGCDDATSFCQSMTRGRK